MGFPAVMNQLFITIYRTRVLRNGEMQFEMERFRWAWVGLTDFFKFRKNKRARHQSCQQLSILTVNRDGGVTKRKRAGNFLIHFVCLIETWTGEIFFYQYYGQIPSTSYLQDLSQKHMHMALVVVVAIDDFVVQESSGEK